MSVSVDKKSNMSELEIKLFAKATKFKSYLIAAATILAISFSSAKNVEASPTLHTTTVVQNQDIFYREAGVWNTKTIVLLYGFSTSSHMYRDLIPK